MSAEDDFFLIANLSPAETRLPMGVWVSERGNARHDLRIKACPVLRHGVSKPTACESIPQTRRRLPSGQRRG
jgi:hypothetical protein